MNLNQITLPVSDIAAAEAFYRDLGFEQIVRTPHYARFKSSTGDTSFSIHKVEGNFNNGAVIYFECRHLDDVVDDLKRRGVTFVSDPSDQTWLWREARLRDPSDNELCLYWAGENRLNPPWRLKPGQ